MFLDELKERMRQFALALHPNKTRLIRFGRHSAKQRAKLGEGKPESFDFLGFTHFCTRSRKWGSFVIGRQTIKKRTASQAAGDQDRVVQDNARPIAWASSPPFDFATKLSKTAYAAMGKCSHEEGIISEPPATPDRDAADDHQRGGHRGCLRRPAR
jgi:hypothetical protein